VRLQKSTRLGQAFTAVSRKFCATQVWVGLEVGDPVGLLVTRAVGRCVGLLGADVGMPVVGAAVGSVGCGVVGDKVGVIVVGLTVGDHVGA